MDAQIELFEEDGTCTHESLPLVDGEAEKLVAHLSGRWSGLAILSHGGTELWVSCSGSLFSVSMSRGEDQFYDLVGDPDISGEVLFAHGGQEGFSAARHIIARRRVVEVVGYFLHGDVLEESGHWEQQGDFLVPLRGGPGR